MKCNKTFQFSNNIYEKYQKTNVVWKTNKRVLKTLAKAADTTYCWN